MVSYKIINIFFYKLYKFLVTQLVKYKLYDRDYHSNQLRKSRAVSFKFILFISMCIIYFCYIVAIINKAKLYFKIFNYYLTLN